MPKYVVDLWLDGYDSEDEMEAACDEFIYEQLNFTASSVRFARFDVSNDVATLRAENERLNGEAERLREALEWLREVDDVREWLAEFPWLRKWSGLDQCMNESRAAVDKLLTIHPPNG